MRAYGRASMNMPRLLLPAMAWGRSMPATALQLRQCNENYHCSFGGT